MADDHPMDVDIPSSGGLSASSSSSSTLDITGVNLDTLNVNMKIYSKVWSKLIDEATDEEWIVVFSHVLGELVSELTKTELKNDIIAAPSSSEKFDIVRGFNEKEVEQWKVGVRNGVENDDWSTLIMHRTYISEYCMVGSGIITINSKAPKSKIAKCSHGRSNGTQYASSFPISFCYDTHIPPNICPGSEEGTSVHDSVITTVFSFVI
jgi:hypothetical protein